MNLYPSILTTSVMKFQEQVAIAAANKDVSTIQVDILDGYFVDNTSVSPLDITQIEYENLQIDFHLMVEEPLDFLHEIIAVKKYLPVRGVIAQIERMTYQDQFIEELEGEGWKTGFSLDLHTPVTAIDQESWEELDIIQLMTVEAGFQGQEFQSQTLRKIPQIRDRSQKAVELILDGGVKHQTLKLLQQEDVNSVVIGSGVWEAADPDAKLAEYVAEIK